MIKVFELFVRKPELDLEDYLERLSAAAAGLPAAGARGYIVQRALPLPARADIVQLNVPSSVDAFLEIWADDLDSYRAALASRESEPWRSARAALVLQAKTLVLVERPQIPVPTPRPPARNNAFLTRHQRFTLLQFRHEWHVGHGHMSQHIPYLRGFVPCDVIEVVPQQGGVAELQTDAIEGIAQAYFDSAEDEMAMIRTPQAKEWFAHGAQTFGLIKAFGAREVAAVVP